MILFEFEQELGEAKWSRIEFVKSNGTKYF